MKEKKDKTTFQRILILIGIIVGWFILVFIILIVMIFITEQTVDTSTPPTIAQEEFPFKLEYEIDGERKNIENIWVIEYAGERQNFELGGYRTWYVTLKSRRTKIILYEKDNIRLDCYPKGEPDYFMGGDGYEDGFTPDFPVVYETTVGKAFNIGNDKRKRVEEYELLTKYKFKWIGGEYPDPIVNDFGEDK